MNRYTQWLLRAYTDESDRGTARLLGNIILFSILGLGAIAFVTFFNEDPESSVALSVTNLVLLIALLTLRIGRLRLTSWLLPLIAFTIVSYEVYAIGESPHMTIKARYSVPWLTPVAAHRSASETGAGCCSAK